MSDQQNGTEMMDPLVARQELERIGDQRSVNRRKFLTGVGMAGVAAAGAGVLAACSDSRVVPPSPVAAAGPSEQDVLNFALNLEYLEASFYAYATTGAGIPAANLPGNPTIMGGAMVPFSDPAVKAIAIEIAADELHHVQFLQAALGSSAINCPNLNLNALGIGFGSDAEFLTLSRAFEDTGVSAYGGAATLLSGADLQYAAQILAVEAYHASSSRVQLIQKGITVPALDAQDVPPTASTYFTVYGGAVAAATTSAGFSIIRTPAQVLGIVFGVSTASTTTPPTGITSGGFFPNGVNGTNSALLST
jgi:hypothetical protein